MWHIRSLAIAFVIMPLLLIASISSYGTPNAGRNEPLAITSIDAPDDDIPEGIVQDLRAAAAGHCTRTTTTLLDACRHEIRDDYFVALAKCINLSDSDEREECFDEAEEERIEARAFCREQFESRDDVCDLLGEARYDPEIDPEDFLSPEEAAKNPNPYFPLVPGTEWVYEGDGETITVTVTDETIEILGVACFVVKDVVREGDEVIEDTDDWYAVDREGNVWYMGELTIEFEEGVIATLEGSWKAGVDGAKPGIIMKAEPEVGDAYRQEFLLGEVEDLAEVISVTGDESVPAASCDGQCVVTRELTPIEPGTESNKHYALGFGLILETFPDGTREELVSYTPGDPELAQRTAAKAAAARAGVAANLRVDDVSLGNPFQSKTMIRFELARTSQVSANVYDASGRVVRGLADGPHTPGSHMLEWDGTDAQNHRVAAGIYFVRLAANGERVTRKLVLVD